MDGSESASAPVQSSTHQQITIIYKWILYDFVDGKIMEYLYLGNIYNHENEMIFISTIEDVFMNRPVMCCRKTSLVLLFIIAGSDPLQRGHGTGSQKTGEGLGPRNRGEETVGKWSLNHETWGISGG